MSQEPNNPSELKSGRSPMPVFFFIFLALSLFGGAIYVDSHAAFNNLVYAPYPSSDYLKELSKRPGAGLDGAPIYAMYCSACHQPNGGGQDPLFPPLAGSDWVQTEGPNRMIRLVLDGIQGPIKVNGKDFNNVMPPWKDQLNDEQIAAVLTYIRSTWGNQAAPVTAAQVKAIREAEKARSLPWEPAKLLEVPDK
ncbi:MAG: cytochrome c [Verrucomicrobiota bacterium]